jgi:hypothetical protein
MDRAFRAAAALLLIIFGRPAAASQPAPEGYDRSVDPEKIVLLRDPENLRLSLRYRADEASLDSTYPRRSVIGPESLITYFPNQGGEDQYQGGLVRYELCGPYVVRLQGDFLNTNLGGQMGGISPFASVSISADNMWLYPANERGGMRLGVCDEQLPIWRECPADYAVRIDLAYLPQTERVAIHEWASSGDILDDNGVYRTTERRSDVRAMLDLYWSRFHPPEPRTDRARPRPRQ